MRREAILCVTLVFALSDAYAQTITDVKTGTGTLAEDKDRSTENQPPIDELREKRAQADAELQAISRPKTLAAGAPSGTPQDELLERRTLLHLIVRSEDEQIDDAQRLEQTRQRRTESRTDSNNPAESPPYSIFFADQLWDNAFSVRLAVEGLQSQLSLTELRFNRARESLLAAEEGLRQAAERAEAATGSPGSERQSWLRDLQALRHRAAAAMLQAAELSKTRLQEDLSDARARLQSAERRLESVESHVDFTEADLGKIRTRLSEERQGLAEELERTTAARRQQFDRLRDIERELATRLAKRTDRAVKVPEGLRQAAGRRRSTTYTGG